MNINKGRIYATLPFTERGMSLVINGDPKGNNFLYTCGKTVVIRDIANPGIVDTYTQHSVQATVAQYAPSGYYIASGDVSGKVRIWDTTQKEHILKYEYQHIAGKIKDISWDGEGKRIAICGEGREKSGHVFLWDSGSTVGDITGHSKFINSISFKPNRPYRLVTAGEDRFLNWYEGPPFKYKNSIREHTRFANCVRFSPTGNLACSGGADGLALLLDGKTGEVVGKLGGDKAHAGGIYALSWNSDGTQVLTASGDKTCKIFDVETKQIVTEFKMGNAVEDQQLSCLWQGDYLLSVSLGGYINYLDKNNPNKPLRVLTGHNKNITSITLSPDQSHLFSGSYSGRIVNWEIDGNDQEQVHGKPHSNQICSLDTDKDKVYSLGFDKTLRSIAPASNEFDPACLTLDGLDPVALAVAENGTSVTVAHSQIVVSRGSQLCSTLPVKFEPTSITWHSSNGKYAVGGKDSKVHIYSLSGTNLQEEQVLDFKEEVSVVRYSADGSYLAVGSGRYLYICASSDGKVVHEFLKHLSRLTCVAWSPNSKKLVSGSVDTNLVVWNLEKPDSPLVLKAAHPLNPISTVVWISDTKFASGGHDNCIRSWELV